MPTNAAALPQHLATYGRPDAAELAAAYAVGLARNHPFIDGNKRTAFVAVATFLLLNGLDIQASEQDATLTFWRLADGSLPEPELAAWFRNTLRPVARISELRLPQNRIRPGMVMASGGM